MTLSRWLFIWVNCDLTLPVSINNPIYFNPPHVVNTFVDAGIPAGILPLPQIRHAFGLAVLPFSPPARSAPVDGIGGNQLYAVIMNEFIFQK